MAHTVTANARLEDDADRLLGMLNTFAEESIPVSWTELLRLASANLNMSSIDTAMAVGRLEDTRRVTMGRRGLSLA